MVLQELGIDGAMGQLLGEPAPLCLQFCFLFP